MLLSLLQLSDTQDFTNGPGGMTVWHSSKTLLVRILQIAGLQGGCVVVAGFVVVVGFVVVDGVVGITHGVPGTSHWPAESEQLSTWPFGERQSLFCELSQVPHCPSVFPPKRV